MPVVKAELKDIDKCVDILFVPEIGQLYYPLKEHLYDELKKGINANEVYVDYKEDGETIQGVLWYQKESLFLSFPYLHMIAVGEEVRNRGVGNRLMDFYEQESLKSVKGRLRVKAFLLVNEKNLNAQKFYERRGYEGILSA